MTLKIKKSKSRTINSRNNFITGVIGQILVLIMAFLCRTVFVKTLGAQYLGINGLFTNIISLLSLTELGLGTSIIFNLYKPIAEDDKHQIYLLMKFYKTAYQLIGWVIIALGLIICPFLRYVIKDLPDFINVYFIFILFLAQSASSYFFFAYKSAILRANQQVYVINTTKWGFTIGLNVIQMLELYFIRSYELYVALQIISNALQNTTIAKQSDKLFPFINAKSEDKLSWAEMKDILKNCYALSLWKMNAVVVAATDNVVLSTFIGISIVGLYSNFQLLRSQIGKLTALAFSSMTASLGNLHAKDGNRSVKMHKIINFMTFNLYGVIALGFFFVANPFVKIWLGDFYTLPTFAVFLLSVDLYITGINGSTNMFRTVMGLFQQMKYRPIIGVVVNLVVSIALVKPLGISGVILGTIACNFLVYFWFEPIILYKYGFKASPVKHFVNNIKYALMIFGCGLVIYWVINTLQLANSLNILLGCTLSVILPLTASYIIFHKSEEFIYIKNQLLPKLLKKKKVNN